MLIRNYLKKYGEAKHQNIVTLLRMESNLYSSVLRALVKEGKLVVKGRQYILPKD